MPTYAYSNGKHHKSRIQGRMSQSDLGIHESLGTKFKQAAGRIASILK